MHTPCSLHDRTELIVNKTIYHVSKRSSKSEIPNKIQQLFQRTEIEHVRNADQNHGIGDQTDRETTLMIRGVTSFPSDKIQENANRLDEHSLLLDNALVELDFLSFY